MWNVPNDRHFPVCWMFFSQNKNRFLMFCELNLFQFLVDYICMFFFFLLLICIWTHCAHSIIGSRSPFDSYQIDFEHSGLSRWYIQKLHTTYSWFMMTWPIRNSGKKRIKIIFLAIIFVTIWNLKVIASFKWCHLQ